MLDTMCGIASVFSYCLLVEAPSVPGSGSLHLKCSLQLSFQNRNVMTPTKILELCKSGFSFHLGFFSTLQCFVQFLLFVRENWAF